MENSQDMVLVGYFHFESKDKKNIYYVVQCLVNKKENNNNKGSMINIFVDDDLYKRIISDYDIGSVLKVNVKPNFETGKLSYKVVL